MPHICEVPVRMLLTESLMMPTPKLDSMNRRMMTVKMMIIIIMVITTVMVMVMVRVRVRLRVRVSNAKGPIPFGLRY